jgi:glycosyltransferase involved in cell wall biosynthesis
MKIVHLNTHDWYGGASIVAYRLALKQRALNHDSKILCGYKATNDPDCLTFPIGKVDDDKKIKEGWVYANLTGSEKLPNHPVIAEADILNIHNLHGGYFNYEHLPLLANRITTVWTLHDMQAFTGRCAHSFSCNRWASGCGQCPHLDYYPESSADASAGMWLEKKEIYKKSSVHLISPSRWLKNKVENSLLAEKEVSLIHNGVDEKKYRPMPDVSRKIHGLNDSSILVGFLAHGGVKNPYKGGRYLLDAVKALSELFPEIYFLEIGGDPKDNKLPDKFIKATYTKNENIISRLYNSVDLLIYPSIADNCPLVVLEAMSCGTPIIAFPVGGIPELIEHNHSGFITDEISTDSLIRACSSVIRSKGLRQRFGKESRNRVLKFFTLDQQTEKYINLYKELKHKACSPN